MEEKDELFYLNEEGSTDSERDFSVSGWKRLTPQEIDHFQSYFEEFIFRPHEKGMFLQDVVFFHPLEDEMPSDIAVGQFKLFQDRVVIEAKKMFDAGEISNTAVAPQFIVTNAGTFSSLLVKGNDVGIIRKNFVPPSKENVKAAEKLWKNTANSVAGILENLDVEGSKKIPPFPENI
jgi:hypothetical protein